MARVAFTTADGTPVSFAAKATKTASAKPVKKRAPAKKRGAAKPPTSAYQLFIGQKLRTYMRAGHTSTVAMEMAAAAWQEKKAKNAKRPAKRPSAKKRTVKRTVKRPSTKRR